jgi:hypothetical protein
MISPRLPCHLITLEQHFAEQSLGSVITLLGRRPAIALEYLREAAN